MTASVLVRPACDDELDAAGELVARAYLTESDIADNAWYLDVIRDARGRARDSEVLVAVDGDGTLLGCVSYVPDHASPLAEVARPGEAEFRMLGVDPITRGRGVGRALVDACIDRARGAGRGSVAISTAEGWAKARRLYERIGFVRAPERDFEPVPGVNLVVYVLAL